MGDPKLDVIKRLHSWAKETPEQIAIEKFDGPALSFAELASAVSQQAEQLRRMPLQYDLPVLLQLPHDILKVTLILALLEVGVPTISLDLHRKISQIRRNFEQIPLQGLIAASLFTRSFRLANADLVGEGLELATRSQDIVYTRFKFHPENQADQRRLHAETAWLLMTSGSTGTQKAVELSARNLNDRTHGEIELLGLKSNTKILNLLSFSHDLGLNQLLTSVTSGATLVLGNQFLADLIPILRRGDFAGVTGTPHLWSELLKLERSISTPFLFSGYLTISGGALNRDRLVRMRHLFPNARLVKTYGQTETFRTLASDDPRTFESPGLRPLISGVRALLVNEQFHEVSRGEIGQLIHFGSGSMSGYFSYLQDDPESKAKFTPIANAFIPWQRGIITGDYFRQDASGDFEFVGRRDDLVKRRDFRVSLEEIRQTLCRFSGVNDAFVAMLEGKDRYGDDDRLVAWLECDETYPERIRDLEKFCQQELSPIKIPDEFRVVQKFERTAAGKIERQRLIESFTDS